MSISDQVMEKFAQKKIFNPNPNPNLYLIKLLPFKYQVSTNHINVAFHIR
jgi:hypothetical protein